MKKFLLILLLQLILFLNAFSYDFSAIDEIISNGIINKSFPGAQLIIGNSENTIYEKSYGNFTYDDFSKPVTKASMFDLASITKVVATTSAIMHLYENYKIDLNDYVSKYIPEFANNGKEQITILNLLLHNTGLIAWIPFYKDYTTREEVLNTIFNIGLDYPTNSKSVYSDLNAILLGLIVEKVSGMKLDEFCKEVIFQPLGMDATMFVPEDRLKEFILPTEYDNYWRSRLIQGEVHDEATSLLGGVSGNAGLFSNASDLYDFMRVMLTNGKYYNPYTRGLREERLYDSSIISLFTKRFSDLPYENSRALGWDTKPISTSGKSRIPCGELISENCFGHTGFTGTTVWCDRDRDLIIIFLTNRIYPTRENYGIREIRPEVHNTAIQIVSGQN